MRKAIALLAGTMLLPAAAQAATTVSQLGTKLQINGVEVVDGQAFSTINFNGSSDPAPFDVFIGAEGGDDSIPFSTTWTHNYGAIAGTVSSAAIEFGFHDIDGGAAGEQVALFSLNGVDLTSLLSTLVESRQDGQSVYGIYTINLPSTVFASVAMGTSTFALNLQGPSLGLLGVGGGNAGRIDFAKLTINTGAIDPGPGPGPDPVPEPAAWAMMIAGFGLIGTAMRRRRVTVSFA